MSLWLSGISVSRGIAIGPVHRVHTLRLDIPEYAVATNALDAEVARFEDALAQARAQLQTIRSQVPANAASEIGAFIETHLLMMQDSALTSTVAKLIRGRGCNAEWALQLQQDQLTDAFNQMEDAYLKQRAADVEHVTARIQRVLLKQERHIGPQPTALRPPPVMVADDLTPADIAVLHQQGVSAVICEHGGPLSHSAILARSLRIPAIMGVHGARRILLDGETAVVDGEAGHVLAAPDANALAFYHHRQKRDQRYRHMLGKLTGEPAISTDGVKVRLLANVELPEDSEHAAAVGAEGIGLYRTEFLYMNRQDCPSEEEQLAAYRQVLRSVDGPVTIRTLDLGADKTAGHEGKPAHSSNPALGLRAIRFCLKETELFKVQLRALLRASAQGDVRIMLPMISTVQELRQTRNLIQNAMESLRAQGHPYNPDVAMGAMIEVPAAALSAPLLAAHADFFSLGTNDLIQYTLAMDRVDDQINYLYDPLHPAVLHLIKTTIRAGAAAGIPVGLCGEMASDQRYTRLLLGLGLTEFSMHPSAILEVKRLIMVSNVAAVRDQVNAVLASTDAAEYRARIEALNEPA